MKTKIEKNDIFRLIRSYSMVIVLVFIAVLFHFLTDGLIFTSMNLTNIILQNSYIVILILGMLPVILTGNIDLSVGSIVALAGAVAAKLQVNMGWDTLPTCLVALAIGVAIGAWNGLWIAKYDIPGFIVTLASQLAFRGLAQVFLQGASIGPFKDSFRDIAGSFVTELISEENAAAITPIFTMVVAVICCLVYVFMQIKGRRDEIANGVPAKPIGGMVARTAVICAVILGLSVLMASYKGYPTVLVIMLVLSLVYSFICKRTTFGRSLYAIGGNRKAAALSGIKDRRNLFLVYVNMGLMAGMAAVVYTARLNAATPKAGVSFETDAIAACFVGGAAVSGGSGTIGGALIGCFVIGILNNGMSMMGVSADWQQTVKGLVILAAVCLDMIPKKKKK